MQTAPLTPVKMVSYGEYDFDKHGGATGAAGIDVPINPIQAGAIITGGGVRVKEDVVGSGASTVAIDAVGTADIMAATDEDNMETGNGLNIIPDGTGSTGIYLTETLTHIKVVIAAAPLTAGKFVVYLEYVVVGE